MAKQTKRLDWRKVAREDDALTKPEAIGALGRSAVAGKLNDGATAEMDDVILFFQLYLPLTESERVIYLVYIFGLILIWPKNRLKK